MAKAQEINLGLEGAFKVDVYDGNNKLIQEGEWFNNFITQSGLKMVSYYPFADCFRFLSIGQGNNANTTGTTFLTTPHTNGVQHSAGTQSGIFMGRNIYHMPDSNGFGGGCGTVSRPQGPSLYRTWQMPTGENTLVGSLTINEFSVHATSGDSTLYGTGSAFSRVVRSIVIPAGTKALISYRLNLNVLNTGVTTFDTGTFLTTNANIDNDGEIVSGWKNTSGYYKQIYHGFRLIDKYGSTFTPEYGDAMEPCLVDENKISAYFSPDLGEFEVSVTGGKNSSSSSSYLGDGLITNYSPDFYGADASRDQLTDEEYYQTGDLAIKTITQLGLNSSIPDSQKLPSNIRLKQRKIPITSDYRTETTTSDIDYTLKNLTYSKNINTATVGASGINNDYLSFGDKAIVSALTANLAYNYDTGRTQSLTRKIFFPPVNSLGWNSRVGSFVIAYNNNGTYYPIVDGLLFDSSGRATPQRYRILSGAGILNSGSGVYKLGYDTNALGHYIVSGVVDSSGHITGFQNNGYNPLTIPDYGVADHSLYNRVEPNATGAVYYPSIFGNQLSLNLRELTYSGESFNFTDQNDYISDSGYANYRIFDTLDLSSVDATLASGISHRLNGDVTNLGGDYRSGYFLFSGTYNNSGIKNNSTFLSQESGISVIFAEATITYYGIGGEEVATKTFDISNQITTNEPFSITDQDSMYGNRLTGLFENSDAGLLNRGVSGNYTGVSAGVELNISGSRGGETFDLTLHAVDSSLDGVNIRYDISNLPYTGILASFNRPSGVIKHQEGFRILPNHGVIQESGSNTYNIGEYGGAYPAMSYDNTLEMYFQLNWSSTCGGISNCTEPTI